MNIDDIAKLISDFEKEFNGVYIINPDVLKKVHTAHGIMARLVNRFGGHIDEMIFEPREIHARFCVTLNSLDVITSEKAELMMILSWSSVLAIEPINSNEFTMEFNIPNLWVMCPES